MGGIALRDGELPVEREPNELDELAGEFSSILNDLDIGHAFVAGYVAILAGRSRATQDIDVLLERVGTETVERLATRLDKGGFWGPAMPLDATDGTLSDGGSVWVARDDEMVPHLDVKFASDEFDRASLTNAITARIDTISLPIGPLELQIAYKLYLGDSTSFEDAAHLYAMFEGSLGTTDLEAWVERLDVREEYERLGAT